MSILAPITRHQKWLHNKHLKKIIIHCILILHKASKCSFIRWNAVVTGLISIKQDPNFDVKLWKLAQLVNHNKSEIYKSSQKWYMKKWQSHTQVSNNPKSQELKFRCIMNYAMLLKVTSWFKANLQSFT